MIQVYTGDGKGKTTAALGLALRAAGAGLNVYIAQFLKGKPCSEIRALKKFKNITIEQFGSGCFIKKRPSDKDIKLAEMALKRIEDVVAKKKFNVIILDEVNSALGLKLFTLGELNAIIAKIPKQTELILTGRNASVGILQIADLISEIKEIKHYFKKGLRARKGIEF